MAGRQRSSGRAESPSRPGGWRPCSPPRGRCRAEHRLPGAGGAAGVPGGRPAADLEGPAAGGLLPAADAVRVVAAPAPPGGLPPADGEGVPRRPRRRHPRLRPRPGRLAHAAGRRAHPPRRGVRRRHGGPPRRGGAPPDVGDGQVAGRLREGVRPHGGLHPGDDRGAQGPRPGLVALRHRAGGLRPDPPRPAGRGPLHGAVQLPAQRDLHHPHPGPDHGQHRRVQAAQDGGAAVAAPARGLPRLLPAGRGQHGLRRRRRRWSAR